MRSGSARRIRRLPPPACIASCGISGPNRRRGAAAAAAAVGEGAAGGAGGRPPGGRGGGGGGGGRGGLPPVAAGSFSVKLTVNGKSYTQPLTVKPDPRER